MKKIRPLLPVLLLIMLLLAGAVTPGFADFGGFAGDSDYGGGYDDYGGYSSWDDDDDDWSYSSSWYDDDDDDSSSWDHDYDGDYEDFEISDEASTVLGGVIVAAIIIWIVVSRFRKKMSNSNKYNGVTSRPSGPRVSNGGATPTDRSKLIDMSRYKTHDPNFSEADFKEKIANMYVRFQNQWTAKDMEPMRGEMTDALYNQIDRQLQQLKDDRRTNRVDNIAVLDVTLRGYMQNDEQDTVVAMVKTRIIDYYVDDDTGDVVKGSRTTEKFMTYEWEMIRKKGMKTGDAEHGTVINCPNCGAPVNINHSARCEYCDSILTNADYDWVLASVKGISQRSAN